jgi:hypothetical protein
VALYYSLCGSSSRDGATEIAGVVMVVGNSVSPVKGQ